MKNRNQEPAIIRITILELPYADVEDKLGENLLLEEGELEELPSMDPDVEDKLEESLLQEQGELW